MIRSGGLQAAGVEHLGGARPDGPSFTRLFSRFRRPAPRLGGRLHGGGRQLLHQVSGRGAAALTPVLRGPTPCPPRAPFLRGPRGDWRAPRRGRRWVGFYVPELCGGLRAGGGVGSASPRENRGRGPGAGLPRGWGLRAALGTGTWAGFGLWCEGRDTPPLWGSPAAPSRAGAQTGMGGGGESRLGAASEVWGPEVGRVGRGQSDEGILVWGGLPLTVFSGRVEEGRRRTPLRPCPARARRGEEGVGRRTNLPVISLELFCVSLTGAERGQLLLPPLSQAAVFPQKPGSLVPQANLFPDLGL